MRRSYDDLGSLRIEDPNHPDRVVVAARAPWFMTLFGRDSLLASQMALPVNPSLALGTLQTLADRQGTTVVEPMNEEEPCMRSGSTFRAGFPWAASQHTTAVGAIPLFLMILGSVNRWGFAKETIAAVLPHADRALEWIRDYGDKDGHSFVEYERLNDQGLIKKARGEPPHPMILGADVAANQND